MSFKSPPKIKSSTLSLYEQPEQVFTFICIYSSWLSSAGSALVESGNCKIFVLNGGILTDVMSALPMEPGWCAVHSILSRLLSARSVPCGWAYRPVWIDCKDTIP